MLYTIQKGDTLSTLAKRYKTSVGELAKRNKIANVNRIYAGATLDIPDMSSEPQADESKTNIWNAPSYEPKPAAKAEYAPQPYKSTYSDEIDALIKELEERDDFSYDYSEDPLFENYRENYTRGGELAMRDSMGEAAALTGGYGSSYAQSVGQQTYQAYMSALSDKAPELASKAYDRYMDEGTALKDRLEAYGRLDAADYERYRDSAEDELERERLAYERYRDAQEDSLERYKLERDEQRYQQEQQLKQDAQSAKGSGGSTSNGEPKKEKVSKSSEQQAIYELFEGMTPRERRAILADLPSIEYMRDVLGEDGYTEIKKKYGAS